MASDLEVRRKDVRVGDTVLIEKAGEVIPQVVKVIESKRPAGAKPFRLPRRCPVCASAVLREERRRSSLVRAFMGEPLLVLLEQQRGALPSGLEAEVINAIGETRQRGGAVLWLTRDAALFRNQRIPASQRLRLFAGRLQSLEAA